MKTTRRPTFLNTSAGRQYLIAAALVSATALIAAVAFTTVVSQAADPAGSNTPRVSPMPEISKTSVSDAGSGDTRALLERILDAVEKQKRPHWMQVTRAIVLSLAALASAWSAYQASRWNSVAGSQKNRAASAKRLGAMQQFQALQLHTLDAMAGLHLLDAMHAGNEQLAEFLRTRTRSEFKPALEAWLKTEPLTNPAAPLTPFVMKEHVSKELQAAERHEQEAQQHEEAGAAASRSSNSFVLLTLLFATVLFLGGLASSLPAPGLEYIVSVGALLVFASTLLRLITLPIAPWK
jgi:hypothetical protein